MRINFITVETIYTAFCVV